MRCNLTAQGGGGFGSMVVMVVLAAKEGLSSEYTYNNQLCN